MKSISDHSLHFFSDWTFGPTFHLSRCILWSSLLITLTGGRQLYIILFWLWHSLVLASIYFSKDITIRILDLGTLLPHDSSANQNCVLFLQIYFHRRVREWGLLRLSPFWQYQEVCGRDSSWGLSLHFVMETRVTLEQDERYSGSVVCKAGNVLEGGASILGNREHH